MDDQDLKAATETSLEAKVRFLGRPDAYASRPNSVVCRETHMSWVFLTEDHVYKLKKPVRFSYLDFSTIDRRERACRAELKLNQRLAQDVYLDVQPLTVSPEGLTIGAKGAIVDWLVVMRRLDDRQMLDRAITDGWLEKRHIDRLARRLTRFYRNARHVPVSPAVFIANWHRSLVRNRNVLLDPRFRLHTGLIRWIDRTQRNFLKRRKELLIDRVRASMIVDGHGDLRPEHIWIGEPIHIIDCLEFNAELRTVDPLDEIAYLSVECDRLGAKWIGKRVEHHIACALHDGGFNELFSFYRCHRATLRARLAIAHLLEQNPRTPEKWPRLAQEYLALASNDAIHLEQFVRTPAGR